MCVYSYMHIYIYVVCNDIMHKKTATKEFQNTNFLK